MSSVGRCSNTPQAIRSRFELCRKLAECNCEYCQAVVEKYLRASPPAGQVTLDAIATDGGGR